MVSTNKNFLLGLLDWRGFNSETPSVTLPVTRRSVGGGGGITLARLLKGGRKEREKEGNRNRRGDSCKYLTTPSSQTLNLNKYTLNLTPYHLNDRPRD